MPTRSPWRVVAGHVLPAWGLTCTVAAAIVALTSAWDPASPWPGFTNLSMRDGRWYEGIALRGYPNWNETLQQSGYPFFPLYPWLIRLLLALGIQPGRSGPAITMLAAGLGLWGVYRLGEHHASARAAALAVWSMALFPMAAVFSLAYPSGLLLASSVWAFARVERRHDLSAGLLAAVACLSRPNGFVVAIALAARGWPDGGRLARLAGPSVAALGIWMLTLWRWTDDPLIFLTAKGAWHEVTVLDVVLLRSADPSVYVHLTLGLAAAVVLFLTRHRLPITWTLFAWLYLLPSLVLGVVGMGRLAAECFPVGIATGIQLEGASRGSRRLYFLASASLAVAIAAAFGAHALLP